MSDTPAPTADWVALAAKLSLGDFVQAAPRWMLVGTGTVKRAMKPQKTLMSLKAPTPEMLADAERETTSVGVPPVDDAPTVLAVRKVQSVFPSMITVGRTANNDIVVPDVSVSRFHAFFRETDGNYELADAGSSNGTWIAGRKLASKGAGAGVVGGEVVRFGNAEFLLVDAADCWRRLRKTGGGTPSGPRRRPGP